MVNSAATVLTVDWKRLIMFLLGALLYYRAGSGVWQFSCASSSSVLRQDRLEHHQENIHYRLSNQQQHSY